jgi:hypothetical protein
MSHRPCDHIFANWVPAPRTLDGAIYLWRYCLIPGCKHEEWEYENWEKKDEAA